MYKTSNTQQGINTKLLNKVVMKYQRTGTKYEWMMFWAIESNQKKRVQATEVQIFHLLGILDLCEMEVNLTYKTLRVRTMEL